MYKTSLLIYCSCILVVQTTQALPSGSVGCEGGQAAVGGLHTSAAQQTIVTGPLSQDFIDFEINGVPLQPGVPFDIEIGVDHQWKLVATGSPFRGFLARLGRGDSNVDTRSTLWTDSDSAQIAQRACIEAYLVGGVTHTNNDLKTEEEGTLRMELPSQNMQLDVTVVIQVSLLHIFLACDDHREYYLNTIMLNRLLTTNV